MHVYMTIHNKKRNPAIPFQLIIQLFQTCLLSGRRPGIPSLQGYLQKLFRVRFRCQDRRFQDHKHIRRGKHTYPCVVLLKPVLRFKLLDQGKKQIKRMSDDEFTVILVFDRDNPALTVELKFFIAGNQPFAGSDFSCLGGNFRIQSE